MIDVGCGCGASSLRCAQQVGAGGSVLGVDVSRRMLERARERARGLSHVAFREADASVYPFASDADRVYSRLRVMFFAEPAAAFANLRRALRPGGMLCVVTWRSRDENPWYTVPHDAVDFALLAGPLARALFENTVGPALVAQVRSAVREALAPFESAGVVALVASFRVATARA